MTEDVGTVPSYHAFQASVVEEGSQSPSSSQPILQQPQPIRDVVDRAVDDAIHETPNDPHADPNFIAKVAEQVAKHLREAGVTLPAPPQSHFPPSPPHVPAQPKRWSIDSLKRHSPSVASESADKSRSRLTSPEPALSGSEFDNEDRYQSQAIDDDTAEASSNQHSTRWAGSNADARPRRDSSAQRRVNTQAGSPPADYWDDMTAVEKAWKPLFDRSGHPLPRLGHFLRGLALHLIEDYEPKNSLVVTPAKMLRFFEETRLDHELYPWTVIFSTTSQSLSMMYQKLLAQHHLVQTANHSSPNVPALTPHGFECFMTLLIQAHPDQEYRRISEAVKHMPISSAEDGSFRFPKELTRRLLPSRPNNQAAQRLTASMSHESKITLRNSAPMPPPPPQASSSGRERRPTAQRVPSNAVDDEDLYTAAPIERERKPYVAREGSGKIHEVDIAGSYDSNRGDEMPRPVRQSSSSTVLPSSRARQPTGPGTQPPVSFNNYARSTGRRSPPLASSWGDSSTPSEMQWSGSRSDFDPPTDVRRTSRRRAQSGSFSHTDYESRSKPIPVRGQGAEPMPPPLPPIATSLPRGSSQVSYDEHRRRSAYTAAPSGPEGWGQTGYADGR